MAKRKNEGKLGSRNVTRADREAVIEAPSTKDCPYWEQEGRDRANARREALRDQRAQRG